MEYFTTQKYQIRTIEKDSGIVYAEKMALPSDSGFCDCGKPGWMEVIVERQIGFNVFVQPGKEDQGTKVTVNADFKEGRRSTWDGSYYAVNCVSTSRLETEILGSLSELGANPSEVAPASTQELAVAEPITLTVPSKADELQRYNEARALYDLENYTEALKQFERYIEEFPNGQNVADASYWKAHSAFRLGDFHQAIVGFEEVCQKYPTSEKVPAAMHNAAVAYARLGQNSRATELLEQLVAKYPDDPFAKGAQEKIRQLKGK